MISLSPIGRGISVDSLYSLRPQIVSDDEKGTKLHSKQDEASSEGDGKGFDRRSNLVLGRASGAIDNADNVGHVQMLLLASCHVVAG